MGRLLSAAVREGAGEVRINRLLDQTYFAEIVVIGPDGEQVLDARPSDALGVALHMRAPLAVAANVFEVAATYDITLPEPSVASAHLRSDAPDMEPSAVAQGCQSSNYSVR